MEKNTSTKYILSLLAFVLGITIVMAATFHIAISVVAVFTKHHLYYINPIRFLGISTYWPNYQNSDMATILSWVTLVMLYIVIIVIYIRKYDPKLMNRLKQNISYNNETKKLIYETKNANEIDVIPITLLIKQFYKIKDLFISLDTRI